MLITPLLAKSSEDISCNSINIKLGKAQSFVIDDSLYVVIAKDLSAQFANDFDVAVIKKELGLGMYSFFKNKENWSYLEINSSGTVSRSLRCANQIYFYSKTNLTNIHISKLNKPAFGSSSYLTDGEGLNQINIKDSFEQFK